MSFRTTRHITRETEEAEQTIRVVVRVTPATPGVHTLSNGDPGYPGDPAEADVISAVDTATGEAVELTAAEESRLFEDAISQAEDEYAAAMEDKADADAEARREREW